MVIRVSDKTQNYSKVTKLLVKPINFRCRFLKTICTMLSIDMSIHPYQVFLEEEVFNDE